VKNIEYTNKRGSKKAPKKMQNQAIHGAETTGFHQHKGRTSRSIDTKKRQDDGNKERELVLKGAGSDIMKIAPREKKKHRIHVGKKEGGKSLDPCRPRIAPSVKENKTRVTPLIHRLKTESRLLTGKERQRGIGSSKKRA